MWNKLRSRCCRKILSNGAEHKRCAEHCTENIINIMIASIHYRSYIMVSAQLSRYGLDENTWGPKWNNKNWVGFSCHYNLFLQIYQFCKALKFIKAFAWQKSINICRQTVTKPTLSTYFSSCKAKDFDFVLEINNDICEH